MRPSPRWPIAIAASALLLGALVVADTHSAPRMALAMWCLLACPGMSFVPLVPGLPGHVAAVLVLGLSLAIDTAVVTALLVAGVFSTPAAAAVLAALCAAGSAGQLWSWARSRPRTIVVLHA